MKKFIIAVTGGTVVIVGVAMIILPGPAFIVIPAGLAILATEFLWARQALRKCQNIAVQTKHHAKRWWPFNRKQDKTKSAEKSESQPTQLPCHKESR